jgi:hypothetical protein
MNRLESLLAEYCQLLDAEHELGVRKDEVKTTIFAELEIAQLDSMRTPSGSVERRQRFKLTPKRDEVLSLLDSGDLLPFATFTAAKVTEHLVPRYGRERLIALFDIEKTEFVMIKRPPQSRRDS